MAMKKSLSSGRIEDKFAELGVVHLWCWRGLLTRVEDEDSGCFLRVPASRELFFSALC
jgi:hypothetical protein